jgi:CheY-like chemotaxis protein
MPNRSRYQILLVDDDEGVRNTLAMLLTSAGYDVATANDGFEALLHLKRTLPGMIISDLNMPRMSGFEFLSVARRRFPEILVIAMSGAYQESSTVPGGVIADGFYPKGSHPKALFATVADLIKAAPVRQAAHRKESAPVWIPRNGKDSKGIPYIVVTCTECLRSFPLNVAEEASPEVRETPCLFCRSVVRYIIDFSLSIVSPPSREHAVAITAMAPSKPAA